MGIKICHLTSVHQIEDIRIFQKECRSLANHGYDTTLIACGRTSFEVENEKVKLISLNVPVKNRIQRMSKRTRAVYKKGLEVDAEIYHLHDPELIIYGRKLKKKGKKVIFDSHEDISAQILTKKWLPKPFRKLFSSIYSIIEKRYLKYYDAVVSVTPTLTEKLLKINHNTFQITNYPIIEESILLSNPKFSRSIVFAGGITEQWLHKEIIKAIDGIDNIVYKLAGNVDNEYIKQLELLPGWEKVDYVGKIPFESVNSFITQSSVGMALCDYSPNVGEKIGSLGNTKLFEYMMSGLPVICTDFLLWKEIIEENNCGICVNPHNIGEISEAIEQILNDHENAKKMGENGRKLIIERYNWSTQEKMLIRMYNGIS